MKVTITATENYKPGCKECAHVIAGLVAAAIADTALTRLALKAGEKHCHPASTAKPESYTLFTMPPATGRSPNGFDDQNRA
jgi:hypothetical protein